MNTYKLTELTDEQLVGLIGATVVLRLEPVDPDGLPAFGVGRVLNVQIVQGRSLVSFVDGDKSTEVVWDSDQYEATVTW